MRQALYHARVLTPTGFVDNRVLLLHGRHIIDLVTPDDRRLHGAERIDCGGDLLLPGFIDIQVNGGGGVLFNDQPNVEGIRQIAAAHRRFGTTGLLPTLITDDRIQIERAVSAVRDAIDASVPGVLGVHIEGPCLNEVRAGAHDATKFRDLDEDDIRTLCALRNGRTVVTLAPEMTKLATISRLADAGVRISAGHTNARYDDIAAALKYGLTGFTHLFNAMSGLTSREPGVVGAALIDSDSWCGIIVDGHHVDPVVLKLALSCKPKKRFMLVTDGMPCVGTDSQEFLLQGRRIRVEGGRCVDEDGVISGSSLDMASALRNAVRWLGLSMAEAAYMASTGPAEFLGIAHEYGKIAAGYRANLVRLGDCFKVRGTWIDGHWQSADTA